MLIDWQVLHSPPVIVVTHFILFISACKLLERKSHRDWLWLYLVSFFELIMAAGMTIDAVFLALLITFLFSAVSSLISFEIRRAGEAFGTMAQTGDLWREGDAGRRHLIARRLIDGQSNKRVALDLEISQRTVELHRAHIMDKMQARSLAQLVRQFVQAGEA